MVDASHGHVCVSFGPNNTHIRHKTQQAPMKLKLAAGAAGVRRKKMGLEKNKSCMHVKKSKRGACEQKAATVLPNRTAAT